jgi:hypothetical protein
MTTPTVDTTPARPSTAAVRAGWVLSGLEILFLLFDSITKVLKVPQVVTATVQLGFPESTVRAMGILLLIGIVLYAVPRTSVFGAVFVTAYLGGAVCANVRAEMPLLGYVLSPVYTAIALWIGLYLRSAALRQLVRTGY